MNEDYNHDLKSGKVKRFMYVYIVPALLTGSVFVALYLLTIYIHLNQGEAVFGCLIAVIAGVILHLKNRFDWLPLPGGTYINRKDLQGKADKTNTKKGRSIEPFNPAAPNVYPAAFYYKTSSKIVSLGMGIVICAVGVYVICFGHIIFSLFTIAVSLLFLHSAYVELKDTRPKLQLAEAGLTVTLGFTPWSAIEKIDFVKEKNRLSTSTYIKIYLKRNRVNHPDDELCIDDLNNRNEIKKMIDTFFV